MKQISLSRHQSQAYLNEYKGSLFEYLVAQELAKRFHLQSHFMQSLGPNQCDLLQHYERELRKLEPDLAQTLPLLAQETATQYIETLGPTPLTHIGLQGRPLAKGGKRKKDEGDLSIRLDGQDCKHSVSLKLGRVGSFVNTKSAGIKSFLTEYFSPFQSEWEQKKLNQYLEASHLQMSEKLYQKKQLRFNGHWDKQWSQSGLSELPGELPSPLRPIVHDHYRRVMVKLDEILWRLYQQDQETFKLCLSPLLGFSRKLTQIKVYHLKHKLHSIAIINQENILELLNSLKWNREEVTKGFFTIDFAQHQFQLRLKPMNKFTALALKVNCSLKFQGQPTLR